MTNVCAWCGKAMAPVKGERQRINFGICPACLPEWREEMQLVVAAHPGGALHGKPEGGSKWA